MNTQPDTNAEAVIAKEPILFRAFDETGEVRVYEHGILPHWRQRGCTYFVTFRLADSIPEDVLQELEYERALWLKARQIDAADRHWKRQFAKLPTRERRQYEQFVERSVNKSLDNCHGSCVLSDQRIGNIVARALDHFHASRVYGGDFIVMPNHVHALLTPMDGFELEAILHSIKSYTANEINRALRIDGPFWQKESYDHIVRDIEQLEAFQAYIAVNPSKAKLQLGKYILSQATYYVSS